MTLLTISSIFSILFSAALLLFLFFKVFLSLVIHLFLSLFSTIGMDFQVAKLHLYIYLLKSSTLMISSFLISINRFHIDDPIDSMTTGGLVPGLCPRTLSSISTVSSFTFHIFNFFVFKF